MVEHHETIADGYGPGTFVDAKFVGVPAEAHRLLRLLNDTTPNLGLSPIDLDQVDFSGDDLPLIPGPLKSQALVSSVPTNIDTCHVTDSWTFRLRQF